MVRYIIIVLDLKGHFGLDVTWIIAMIDGIIEYISGLYKLHFPSYDREETLT